jgi:hypothetical protein
MFLKMKKMNFSPQFKLEWAYERYIIGLNNTDFDLTLTNKKEKELL